jgi:hypothetical protein
LGLLYFHVLDAGDPVNFGARNGMDVVSVRATGLKTSALPGLSFWGEAVAERGGAAGTTIDANGWYAEGKYSPPGLPWSPSLAYRYAFFSGDPNPEDRRRRDFDPFFYGSSRGWGTWYQGEITGEYLLFNSNQVSQMLHLSASPLEALSVGAIYYWFRLDQKNYFGTPVGSKNFDDELNLYVDWTLNDHVSVSAVYAIAFPRAAAREVLGTKDFQLFEVALYLSF